MEIVKNIAAVLGCILSLSGVFTLCSKHAKEGIARMFKKYGNDSELDDIMSAVKAISDKLDAHIEEEEISQIRASRQRIVRFADELRKGNTPDIEYTDDVLEDIDHYEKYCIDHPKFPNSKAVCAIETIKKYYNSFNVN